MKRVLQLCSLAVLQFYSYGGIAVKKEFCEIATSTAQQWTSSS